MNKVNKKGFTIVELVIVLAVIGILAGILIPTFANVIRKSQISADVQLAKNLNTVLATAAAEGRIPTSMYDVLYLENEAGYIIENLNPTNQDYYFAWDSANNKIVYLMDDLVTVYYPEEYKLNPNCCWITVGTAEEASKISAFGYNLALEKDIDTTINLEKMVSVDTLGFHCSGVSFNGTETETNSSGNAPTVVLTGNFGSISGSIGSASVTTSGVASSVNLSGSTGSSVTVSGYIGELTTTGSASTEVTSTGSIKTVDEVVGGTVVINGTTTDVSGTGSSNVSGATKDAQGRSIITISDKSSLESIRTQLTQKTFKGETIVQDADIDMKNIGFLPLSNNTRSGKGDNFFQGSYDGNGKSILNFSNTGFNITGITAFQNDSSAFFGASRKRYTEAAYGIFGTVYGTADDPVVIKNLNVTCDIDMVVDASSGKVGDSVGGIVGYGCGSIVFDNCTVSGNIASYDGAGGFIGRYYGNEAKNNNDNFKGTLTFRNCINYANVTAVRTAGGFLGYTGVDADVAKATIKFEGVNENRGNVTCLAVPGEVAYGTWIDCPKLGKVVSDNDFTHGQFTASSKYDGHHRASASYCYSGTQSLNGRINNATYDNFTNYGVVTMGDGK